MLKFVKEMEEKFSPYPKQLNFPPNSFFLKTGYYYITLANLELLNSGDPPDSTSQVAGATGVQDFTWLSQALHTTQLCSFT
jgi:hypothetical protein